MVGFIPIIPTTAVTNTETSGNTAISRRPSIPQRIFTSRSATLALSSVAASSVHIATVPGQNSLICSSIFFTLLFAASADT